MLVLVTYDVSTISEGGAKRLRHVAKVCQKYGQRVQNSVFECIVNSTEYTQLKFELSSIIDEEKDSLRFYQIGENYKSKIVHIGVKEALDLEGPLIF